MKMNRTQNSLSPVALLLLASTGLVSLSRADAVDLNYETLSSLEKPIATHIGDTTVELSGLIDGAVDLESDDNDTALTSNFQVSAETQLENSLTVGAAYFGFYTSEDSLTGSDNYTDNVALYVGGTLGTVSAGDVTGMVREQTRRNRGAGNAELNYDNTLGELESRGVAYVGRYGPTQLSAVLDDEGNTDLGLSFQRPLGNTDYRLSTQYRESEYVASDATLFDSTALSLVAEVTYGSTFYDVGIGFEELSGHELSVDRQYISAGVATKIGVLTLSAEAHIGDIEGQDERAYSLGASYDIARGLSLNLGVNQSDSQVMVDGVSLLDDDITEVLFSLRYSY